jgi:hypothetical protein
MESAEATAKTAPADQILYLPGGESEDQYAIVVDISRTTSSVATPDSMKQMVSESASTTGMQDPDVIGAKTNVLQGAKEPSPTSAVVVAQKNGRMTHSDSFDYERVEFIGNVLKTKSGTKSSNTSNGHPSSGIGQEEESALDISPFATSSPASHKVNPFVSPLRPFTAPIAAAGNSPSSNNHLYKSLELEESLDSQSKRYEHVLIAKEDSGLYEPIEAPLGRATVEQEQAEEEEEGIYEPVSPPKSKNQLQATLVVKSDMESTRSETPVSEASSSCGSDEFVEEVSDLSELSQSFHMSIAERQRHELLPRFSVWGDSNRPRRMDSQGQLL